VSVAPTVKARQRLHVAADAPRAVAGRAKGLRLRGGLHPGQGVRPRPRAGERRRGPALGPAWPAATMGVIEGRHAAGALRRAAIGGNPVTPDPVGLAIPDASIGRPVHARSAALLARRSRSARRIAGVLHLQVAARGFAPRCGKPRPVAVGGPGGQNRSAVSPRRSDGWRLLASVPSARRSRARTVQARSGDAAGRVESARRADARQLAPSRGI
jgi:hypothetical protein